MEKFITATGKTIDLAIEAGLTQLGMDRDSVSVEILETPKSGFFGIGASPAKVKLTYEHPTSLPHRRPRSPAHQEASPRSLRRRSRPKRRMLRRSSRPPQRPSSARQSSAPMQSPPPSARKDRSRTSPVSPERTSRRRISPVSPSRSSRRRSRRLPSPRSMRPQSPAPRKSASSSSSRDFLSTWAPTPCRTR